MTVFYVCDVEKNVDCAKTACHINGGECVHTTKIEFMKPFTNPLVVVPVDDEAGELVEVQDV